MVRVRARRLTAAVALVALAAAAACSREPSPEPVEPLASAPASRQAAVETPPPMPSLAPGRTTLTETEARALVLNLVPPPRGSSLGDWPGVADAPLDDAQVRVCDEPYPLPLGGGAADELKDGSDDLLDWYSRGLTNGPGRSVSVTTFVFVDAARAQTALARLASAAGRTCATEDASLAAKPDPSQESADLTVEATDGSYATSVLSLRAGPVLVVVDATAPAFQTAVTDAVAARKWAEAKLRDSGLLR